MVLYSLVISRSGFEPILMIPGKISLEITYSRSRQNPILKISNFPANSLAALVLAGLNYIYTGHQLAALVLAGLNYIYTGHIAPTDQHLIYTGHQLINI